MIDKRLYDQILWRRGIELKSQSDTSEREASEAFPLSYGQLGIWFLQQLHPGDPIYNNPSAFLLKGRLDVALFEKSMARVVKMHPALRTGIKIVGDQLRQHIKPFAGFRVEHIDMSADHVSDEALEREVNRLASQGFDLLRDDFIRTYLLKKSDDEYIALINMHHIISDGWSKGVLLRDLSESYLQLSRGAGEVEEKRISYGAYVSDQRQYLTNGTGKAAEAFWWDYLAGAPKMLDLVPYQIRGNRQSGKGGIIGFDIDGAVYERIRNYCTEKRVTSFMFLLAVMNIFLYKISGQRDLLVGTPVAGRTRKAYENMVGLFVNSVVMRNTVNEKTAFESFLRDVKRNAIRVYANQEYPFNLLVEKLNPQRELSFHPVFQVMMQFDNAPLPPMRVGGLELTPMQVDTEIAQVDLSVTFWEQDGRLKGSFEYSSDLFDEDKIRCFIPYFQNLLREVVSDPTRAISAYKLLDKAGTQNVLYDWNRTETVRSGVSLLDRIKRNAREVPYDTAVIHGTAWIDYKTLLEKTEQAVAVLGKAVQDGSYIALFLESSIEYVIALLAVMASKAAAVPLDVTSPVKRVTAQLARLGDPVVITSRGQRNQLHDYTGPKLVFEDVLVAPASDAIKPAPAAAVEDDLLCCIFTSGSTGVPKGILLEHRSILNLVDSFIHSYNVTGRDCLMSVSGLASASFIGEIYPILCAGGTLVLPEMETLLDTGNFINCMRENNVSILSTVPSMISRINGTPGLQESLRLILSGGESLKYSDIDHIRGVKIANGYGLTESGICNTCKITQAGEGFEVSNIGKPLINNRVYILDDCLGPVPPYVTGEIFIGGEGLAREYLNDRALTEQRFLPDPFHQGRMLRTGDTGFFLPTGEVIFLGRMDRQVQVRGFRVELSEIEKCLRSYPRITDAVAVKSGHDYEEAFILAYYVTEDGQSAKQSEMVSFLRKSLPNYMIPKHFLRIGNVTYNANGKIDLNALPQWSGEKEEALFEKPQSEEEKKIYEVWTHSLGTERIDINDNFFDIGGHSLLLSQVHEQLKGLFDKKITIVDLFNYPTIKSLAEFISQKDSGDTSLSVFARARKQRQAFAKERDGRV
jgi:amino acid adenylation domain-containing protein